MKQTLADKNRNTFQNLKSNGKMKIKKGSERKKLHRLEGNRAHGTQENSDNYTEGTIRK